MLRAELLVSRFLGPDATDNDQADFLAAYEEAREEVIGTPADYQESNARAAFYALGWKWPH
jgi:hypothetical protein